MSKTLENQCVYPIVISETNVPQWGLTKREHFAAMAMQGLLANYSNRGMNIDTIAKQAVNAADELINALNKKNDNLEF
jgi:hypothetical protein